MKRKLVPYSPSPADAIKEGVGGNSGGPSPAPNLPRGTQLLRLRFPRFFSLSALPELPFRRLALCDFLSRHSPPHICSREEVQHCLTAPLIPGDDHISAGILKVFWEWDRQRIVQLVRACIRLGHHPELWKTAKGIVIPKPGKPDYSKVQAYRVICLLDVFSKLVERMAGHLIADHLE